MEKILLNSKNQGSRAKQVIILVFVFAFIFTYFYFRESQVPEEISSTERLKDLSAIILENSEFKTFTLNYFYFKHPDWQKLEIDPTLIWPREIAEKQEILLYLTNPDGVKIIATKREMETEYLKKPYPLVFREIFARDRQILEEKGGILDVEVIREEFFENGVLVELRVVVSGVTNTSIQKSIIVNENNSRFIYSVGISAQAEIFEDYRLLAEYIISSTRYY